MCDLHSQLLHCPYLRKQKFIESVELSSTATVLDSIWKEKVSPTVNSEKPNEDVTVAAAKRRAEKPSASAGFRRAPDQPSCGHDTWRRWLCEGGCEGLPGVRRVESRDKSRWSSWSYRRPRSSCGTRPDDLPIQLLCAHQSRHQGSWLTHSKNLRTSLVGVSNFGFSLPFSRRWKKRRRRSGNC